MLNNNSQKTIKQSPPISRHSLMWLFAIQVFVLIPHFFSVPAWIGLVWLGVFLWRVNVFRGAWNYPNKIQKTVVVICCVVGLMLSLGASFSLTAMISLLLVGSILKMLEMKTQKDFILLVFLAFFILAVQFIFYSDVLAVLYGLFCLVLLCASLMQLYQELPAQHVRSEPTLSKSFPSANVLFNYVGSKNVWRNVRAAFLILLQAIPMMVVLFVIMPRLGSFWSVPSPHHAKTGMSDSMSPGDLSELIESDELTFRVTFSGDIPSHEKLYWRSMVFTYFDGRRWSQQKIHDQDLQTSVQPIKGWRKKIDYSDESFSYNIIAEPTGQAWLYSLAAPKTWSDGVLVGRDLHAQSDLPVVQRKSYSLTSFLQYRLEAEEPEADIVKYNTQLPEEGNPETRRVASEWLIETGNTEKLIEKLFSLYQSRFFYTLQPPSLGENSIDDFLWKSQQGFCEHFSSSFVFFLRAAGIPARVVVGYQGGELNVREHYLTVRQRDAHAWAEVWIKNRGWVLYDPTSAVAPERIRHGISESLSSSDRELLNKPFGSSFTVFNRLRIQWETLNYQWVRWVMNYDSNLQTKLLTKMLSDVNPLRLAILVLVSGVVSVIFIFLILFFRTHYRKLAVTESSSQLVYRQLCKKLMRSGLSPKMGETPHDFIGRVVSLRPELAPQLIRIGVLYEQLAYAENQHVLGDLKTHVAALNVVSVTNLTRINQKMSE